MKCPTCEYELDPLEHEKCPRCGSLLSCSALDCGSCDACAGSFASIGRDLFSRSKDD